MIVMIFSCFVIACGGGPNRDATGFRYWNDPGAFKEYLFAGDLGRFVGFWACLIQAVFAYTGTEVVGMVSNFLAAEWGILGNILLTLHQNPRPLVKSRTPARTFPLPSSRPSGVLLAFTSLAYCRLGSDTRSNEL